ncbi:MAG: ATP-binding protein [Lachnospiraceae bacterium]|nr:ATP-binding protein [Lachnospiraceae bacterium]
MQQNEMRLEFDSRSCNESFARVTVAAFMTQLNPTLEEVADVKTAVSEAVTNAIIHAYGSAGQKENKRCVGGENEENESECVPGGRTGSRIFVEKEREQQNGRAEKIEILCRIRGEVLEVEVGDTGCGIADVKKAMEPLFTTKTECDRAGMGFAFMEAFMDTLRVESTLGRGTRVYMTKRIRREEPLFEKYGTFAVEKIRV